MAKFIRQKARQKFIRGNVTPEFFGNFSRIPNELETIGRLLGPAGGTRLVEIKLLYSTFSSHLQRS